MTDAMTDAKSDFSLAYYRGALEEALRECKALERALGLRDGAHINLYWRLYQWKRLLDALERDEVPGFRKEEG